MHWHLGRRSTYREYNIYLTGEEHESKCIILDQRPHLKEAENFLRTIVVPLSLFFISIGVSISSTLHILLSFPPN